MLAPFFEIQERLVRALPMGFTRSLGARIDWRARLIAVVGPRGVGKTTLLLQHYARSYESPARCLYVSADHVAVQAVGLYEIGDELFRLGGQALLVDEVHRYPGWEQEVKNLYDAFPGKRIVVSGSSSLDILGAGADLSRRVVTYHLPGLSFREFLSIETGVDMDAVALPDLLAGHADLARDRIRQAGGTILDHFRRYLDHGVYPFYLEGVELYPVRLANAVEKVVSGDIPSARGVRPGSIPVLRRLLHLVASSEPLTPNVERMASALGTSKPSVYQFLSHLERAGLLALVPPVARGLKAARKPARVYLDNPNLFGALAPATGGEARIGAVRETFFAHQLRAVGGLRVDPRVDFRLDTGERFAVGGRSKDWRQAPGEADVWLAVDDVEVGAGQRVPLWLFGFFY